MNETELAKVRKYLHAIQRNYSKRCDSCSRNRLNKLVAITDSKLFEEIVVRTYQYEEYSVKKKRIKRRELEPETLTALQCKEYEFTSRINCIEVPSDASIRKVTITDPGSEVLKDLRRRSSRRRRSSSTRSSTDKPLNWKDIGVRFGQDTTMGDGLYIDKVKDENPGIGNLMRGDQILAIEGIVFDGLTLDKLNQEGEVVDNEFRSVPVAVATYYEIATSILDCWITNKWPGAVRDNNKRPELRFTIARRDFDVESISQVPEPEYASIRYGARRSRQTSHKNQEPEEDYVEIELIDFPKTRSGVGAFLTPGPNGIGARVEGLAKGELAEEDGRLQVDDNILYINETPVMNKSFKEVLEVYRQVSASAVNGQTPPRESSLQPIRLIVSRPVSSEQNKNQSRIVSARSITVPQSSVLKEAAKLAAEKSEESKSVTCASDSNPDVAVFAEAPENAFFIHLNQHPAEKQKTNGLERGVVIEKTATGKIDAEPAETVEYIFSKSGVQDQQMDEMEDAYINSDIDDDDDKPIQSSISNERYLAYPAQSASFKSEKNSSDQILSDEKRRLLINHWRSTLDDDSEIIIGEYQLPEENTPLGISVETVASVDMKGDQLDFRHRIVSLKEDGVIAKQTELQREDEILEVSGVVVMGKDSYYFTDTLRQPRTSGYLICSRPLHPKSYKASSFNSDKMGTIYEALSGESTQIDSVSFESHGETAFTPDSKISNIRQKLEVSPREFLLESPRLESLPDRVVVQPHSGRKMSGKRGNPCYKSPNSTDYLPNYADDSMEIVVSKSKGELIGITLGSRDEANCGFVVTDIATNGALYRTLHSVPKYRDVRFSPGDVITELNGKSLRDATLFGVQSLLWGLFSVEGYVSLKFKSKSTSRFQTGYQVGVVEETPISVTESPGTTVLNNLPQDLTQSRSEIRKVPTIKFLLRWCLSELCQMENTHPKP
nr:hypothetical protein HmN_000391800 [Hymenolepis microstoma]